jgi:D-alanine-D-alanine ligase
MGPSLRLRVVVVHNRDFDSHATDDPDFASRADVENAAADVSRALESRGHRATTFAVPAGDDAAARTLAAIRRADADLVFNLCESLAGDARHEAFLPALLELGGVRYTGSGPLALGLALRKDVTKKLLRASGVSTPDGLALDSDDVSAVQLPFPLIVKPAREDASVGISRHSVVHDRKALGARVAEVRARHRQPVLVERYIEGRELYVSLIGNRPTVALPMHEIDFAAMPSDRPRIVSYEGKWVPSSPEYAGTRSVKAQPLSPRARVRCEEAAEKAFHALELRDYARVDLRLAADGTPYVIDVNPNCDLSDGAGVSRAASYGGISYPDLIERICESALDRYRLESEAPRDEPHESASPVARAEPARARAAGARAEPAADPAPAEDDRPRRPRGAGAKGRSLHDGGGVGRARADRPRAH